MKRVLVAAAGVSLLLLLLLIWSVWVEPRQLVVREVELPLAGLQHGGDGLRVALLADLHVGSPHHGLAKLRDIVATVNRRSPDLVLIVGDVVITGVLGGSFVAPEEIAPVLAELKPRLGTYAVLGNHDWWFDAPRVAIALRSAGITVLEDEASFVDVGGARVWLAGVSDLWEGQHDIDAALSTVPDDEPVILFTHNPDIFPVVPESVDLTVAGHTHGGQVNLPIAGRIVVPSQFGQRYAAGHVIEGGRQLFVATGTGTSILPVRFRVPPEIVVLQLQSAPDATAR